MTRLRRCAGCGLRIENYKTAWKSPVHNTDGEVVKDELWHSHCWWSAAGRPDERVHPAYA